MIRPRVLRRVVLQQGVQTPPGSVLTLVQIAAAAARLAMGVERSRFICARRIRRTEISRENIGITDLAVSDNWPPVARPAVVSDRQTIGEGVVQLVS